MTDPFNTQVPGQQELPMPDLRAAPEVGITAAQTAPGSRQRRTEADKAQAALEVATRRVNNLRQRIAKEAAMLEALRADEAAAVRAADYLAAHPALQDDES